MFYLRLARGYRVPDLGRWLLTALAAAVVAALVYWFVHLFWG